MPIPSLSELFFCYPAMDWFYLQPPSRIHGRAHIARVMVWTVMLAQGTPWLEQAVWAAICHDLRRENDGQDLQHGPRAADWVQDNLCAYHSFNAAEVETVANACRWHVAPDRESPWNHPVLWLLKDADGLDRVRLGDLNPSFLRSERARGLVAGAQQLFDLTCHDAAPQQVWEKALTIYPTLGGYN